MRAINLALLVLTPSLALGQFSNPQIESVFPPGGQAGTTITLEVTGTDLDDLQALRFTTAGIEAEPTILPADEIWPEPRQDGLKFTVHIGADVPAGNHEVRALGRFGLSTTRFFVVGPRDGKPELTIADGNETAETAPSLELEQVVNGRTTQNRSDYYKLTAQSGQRVLVHVWGERIDSRIDASVSVFDPTGEQITESLNKIGLDPLADFTAQVDGEYVIKVSDYLFNGGSSYYYRLLATIAPHLDAVFPLAGKAGTRQKFVLYGRNLPGGQPSDFSTSSGDPLELKEVELDVPATGEPLPVRGQKILQGMAESFAWQEGTSNPLRIGIARNDLVSEDPRLDEQVVQPPCEVVGRFDHTGDQDRFRFQATKGDELVIDVVADRAGITVDPTLIIQQIVPPNPDANEPKESSKFLAEADDIVLTSLLSPGGFDTRSRDARLLFTAPEDGEYRVVLGNNMSRAGVLAPYRLGIRAPRHGFKLIAVQDHNWQENRNAYPGVTRLHAGSTTFIRILALREDGFTGPIELAVSGLPPGVYAPPMSIWGPNDEVYLVLSAASHVQDWSGEIDITGRAIIDGSQVEVPAVPGTLVWGAQDNTRNRIRSRATASFPLEVSSESAAMVLQPAETKIWRVELMKTLEIPVKLTKGSQLTGAVKITPYGLPGFTRPSSANVNGEEGVVKVDFTPDGNNKPVAGRGRFVLRGDGVVAKHRANPEAAERWDRWKKHVDARFTQLNSTKSKASSALNSANTARTNAERQLNEHNGARNNLERAVNDAQAKVDTAQREADAAQEAVQARPKAWLASVKSASDANQAARPTLEMAAADSTSMADAAKKTAAQAEAALAQELAKIAENEAALRNEVDFAKAALQANLDAVDSAKKALTDQLAPRIALANAAAAGEIRVRIAKRAATLAESELAQVTGDHGDRLKALVDAKSKAEAALQGPQQELEKARQAATEKEAAQAALDKALTEARAKLEALGEAATDDQRRNAEQAVTAASRQVASVENALAPLRMAQGGAQAKFDDAKKLAEEAAAAIPAYEKAHAEHIATLAAEKDSTAKELQAVEPIFAAATKKLADYDTANKREPLGQALADAEAKIEPARKAVAEAEAKLEAAEATPNQALAKLVTDMRNAELALVEAEAAKTLAEEALAKNQAQAEALAESLAEAQAAAAAAKNEDPADAAKIAELTATSRQTAGVLWTALTALAKAQHQLAVHDAQKSIIERAAAEARARAETAKEEADRLSDLANQANAARNIAATEQRNAQNQARERDAKFMVFSEPIDLRILAPAAEK